ncbi:Up-regulated during septation-domain-containing protein [Echria macrotheca]|uniref:Up-regulated during septation-domain-containing protein n=1 Tax=Echria macrotheca TaxID=438768 RepID=A0AAJ0FAW7_9PEZI|nr:Up-regulated during septation-domain-containing protein [Echria macrotheca]
MAHIAACLLDSEADDFSLCLNNYIAKAVSPQSSDESLGRTSPSQENKPFVWRMHQAERKYQLFPTGKQLPACPPKSLDPEQAFALAMGQNGDKSDKTNPGSGLRIRIKEHNLTRRRKISVPELGPMTTVQEVAMDSPTIPGRPPLHERSISAPGAHGWKHHHLAEHMALSRDQAPDERAELRGSNQKEPQEARQPLSPKSLTPLVIPAPNAAVPRLNRQVSLNRLRSGSTPVEPAIRSAKTDDSPRIRTPFTPLSAALTPKSAATSTMTNSTLPTPVSAPVECRSSPKPWERPVNYAVLSTPKEGASEASVTPKAETLEPPQSAPPTGHRRNQSDTGSIMERGRPRKRNDSNGGSILKRAGSKRSKSAERRAFEQLPKGWKASEAVSMLSQSEVAALQKQALQQASRFEVLRKDDVDNLSRELRQLDERTEYLRRTYTSLRAGRRNLHTRICQYLRSPRTAKFSHDSMLKQEEALAELDASIDDWVAKLEQAENRRTRVRQKLLEHVAAAATLAVPSGGVVGVSESLQLAMGVRPPNSTAGLGNISTPPRSPTKPFFLHTHSSSPSPQRVVAQVPSTILEHPLFEAAASATTGAKEESPATKLRRAETIRIYADNDVYALLADVEHAISKMSNGGDISPTKEETLSEAEKKDLHRARSHELLNNSPIKTTLPALTQEEKSGSSTVLPLSTATPAPEVSNGEEIFLTNAVFKP